MNIEIERKFLVKDTAFKNLAQEKKRIKQGFLNSHKERVVRVRVVDDKAYLTVKGVSDKKGLSRLEWEKEIPVIDAEKLLELCEPSIIKKTRHLHKVGNHVFEIDEFYGDNQGLIIAEIELSNEEENFIKPEYLGKEVTGNPKYYNANLSKNPFKNWT